VVPYLGIPGSWRTAILVLSGVVIVVVGFFLRADATMRGGKRIEHRPFVENADMAAPHLTPNDQKERITSLN